jgi:hypothetical protein
MNFQPNYAPERIPRNEYGRNVRIYINTELPIIKSDWNYTFTIRTK